MDSPDSTASSRIRSAMSHLAGNIASDNREGEGEIEEGESEGEASIAESWCKLDSISSRRVQNRNSNNDNSNSSATGPDIPGNRTVPSSYSLDVPSPSLNPKPSTANGLSPSKSERLLTGNHRKEPSFSLGSGLSPLDFQETAAAGAMGRWPFRGNTQEGPGRKGDGGCGEGQGERRAEEGERTPVSLSHNVPPSAVPYQGQGQQRGQNRNVPKPSFQHGDQLESPSPWAYVSAWGNRGRADRNGQLKKAQDGGTDDEGSPLRWGKEEGYEGDWAALGNFLASPGQWGALVVGSPLHARFLACIAGMRGRDPQAVGKLQRKVQADGMLASERLREVPEGVLQVRGIFVIHG